MIDLHSAYISGTKIWANAIPIENIDNLISQW